MMRRATNDVRRIEKDGMLNKTIELARKQIEFARGYTKSLLADIEDDAWFRQPEGCETHIAWQVGHLAMAEYGLCMFRVRGRRPEDLDLMSGKFRKQFSRGSRPEPDPAKNPSAAEIRRVFDRIHERAMEELSTYDDEQLAETIDEPYAVYNTKLGGILFCASHEMLHAGQIGLLRRLLGLPPIR